MANINRDYLVIADLKSGKITSPNMSFYNTDKNIANLFVKLQITMSTNPSIVGFVNKEEASNYNVKLTVVKPKTTMLVELTGVVQDESVMGNGAVYLFDMPQNFTDQVGKYICELEITCMVNGREEVVTCEPFEYVVKESVVTGLNIEIEPDPDVPVLKQLIDEVRYLQQNGGSIVNLSKYQKLEDERLNTIDKTVVGGINELNDSKVDKIEGKGLSTVDFTTEKDTKLNGIAENANNYTHPINHEPNIITQDATHRFVTDEEKDVWNNKSEFSGSYNDLTEKPDIPSIDGLATEVYVDDKVASIVNSAPETLDTLNELATALGNGPNFATTVANQIGTKASNDYVNAELAKKVNSEGYVATENNYSTAEKTKLANVEDNANNYVHPENHEPSIITQDNEHRFVTDAEKETWNNKLSEHQDISHLAIKSQVDESLSQINQSNIERDKKISSIENINAVQNAKLDTLFNSTSGEMELESNSNNIKLDSSKKGTATVNYIKGNTLVNCAKQNKELILNDEINIEGTTCTINDTVEGGLVDIELEGLSLNNLPGKQVDYFPSGDASNGIDSIVITNNSTVLCYEYSVKPNTTYTVKKLTVSDRGNICLFDDNNIGTKVSSAYMRVLNGGNSHIFTTKANENYMLVYVSTEKATLPKVDIIVLEGDYTNKPIPTEAFTGIKSVGEEVTLTNLVTRTSLVGTSSSETDEYIKLVQQGITEGLELITSFEKDKIYTLVYTVLESTIKSTALVLRGHPTSTYPLASNVMISSEVGTHKIRFKCNKVGATKVDLAIQSDTDEGTYVKFAKRFLIVEGDYENSNLEYFEGSIKKYKIETKTNNKNLFDVNEVKINLTGAPVEYVTYQDKNCVTATKTFNKEWINTFKFKPNTQYRLTYNVYYENALNELKRGIYLRFVYTDGTTSSVNMLDTNVWKTITLISDEGKTVKCIDSSWGYEVSETKTYIDLDTLSLTEGIENVPYTPHKHHKKVILLDEPLRGIEGVARDTTTKIENKTHEKRVCAEVVLNGSENWGVNSWQPTNTSLINMYVRISNAKGFGSNVVCDKFIDAKGIDTVANNQECIRFVGTNTNLVINILKSKLETADLAGFKKWLQANPITVIYELATPIYEEIKDLDNEYPTYAEVTHISTNTVIPCNQKIKNTGIECMLKPSTLYSIHDIRTGSGTAKYNLGGTVNTSNKITTGATLTDNYLRLYGKGLISRDVEVFEGDTPQTPYFSGMLSAFEDKKITQKMVDSGLEKAENLGKYRVGIKVVGKNKFSGWYKGYTTSTTGVFDDTNKTSVRTDYIELDYTKDYFVSGLDFNYKSFIAFYDENKNFMGRTSGKNISDIEVTNGIIDINGMVITNYKYIAITQYSAITDVDNFINNVRVQVEEGTQATQYEDYKEYKTSIFLDNPPLKGNEICVQNGQLGVLHKRQSIIYNGDEDWKLYNEVGNQTSVFYLNFPSNGVAKPVLCDLFSFYQKAYDSQHNREGITFDAGTNRCYVQIYNSKLETKDEAGFKKWLQKNHCKVVYEVLEPHFEPITPQLPRWVLDIFDNSTISIDTIIPVESKFTYTSYIPSIPAMEETNKNQDDLINVSLCATDEMYMMLEPLLQSVPQRLQINERMVSKMVDLYVAMVIRGLKTIDEVPLRYREEVKKILEQLEK
ncbi:CD1375 family protein [Terrisporobacter sp.]|uniref:CD1375 family protein n=1 Tax=Terrisporobacter sp. TaxID=1965305 RepID=UPI002637FBF2|nr:CD1375 family protein [Terrisporobacter sp.]